MVLVMVGCGSKTGFSLGERAAPDAGTRFDTFPCRWSLGEALDIAEAPSLENPRGAIHGSRTEAALLAGDPSSRRSVGARVVVAGTSTLIAPIEDELSSGVAGHAEGYSSLTRACEQVVRDDEYGEIGRGSGRDTGSCVVESTSSEFFDVTYMDDLNVSAIRHTPSGEVLGIATLAVRDPLAASTLRDGARVVHAWIEPDGIAFVGFQDDGAISPALSLGLASSVALDLDRVRPAALVLVGQLSTYRLLRIPFDAPHEPEILEDFDGMLLDATGEMVTNETEAILWRNDGTILAKPLSGAAVRVVDGPPDGLVVYARVILRPGASVGGLLYVVSEPESALLRFRSMICNR